MMVLLFVLLPMLVVAIYASATWWRNRQPSSVESGVDAFRREMTALSPDAAPVQRRPDRPERVERADPADRPPPAGRPPGSGRPPSSGARPAPRRPQGGPDAPPGPVR